MHVPTVAPYALFPWICPWLWHLRLYVPVALLAINYDTTLFPWICTYGTCIWPYVYVPVALSIACDTPPLHPLHYPISMDTCTCTPPLPCFHGYIPVTPSVIPCPWIHTCGTLSSPVSTASVTSLLRGVQGTVQRGPLTGRIGGPTTNTPNIDTTYIGGGGGQDN